jgi:hypothetical protein
VTTTAKRRSTTPRKAARPRANGQANGQAVLPPATDAELRAPEIRPPERFEPTTKPDAAAPPEKIDHPYGPVPIFVFHPRVVKPGDSMDQIVFPHITTIQADVEFFWELDEMDPMHQAFRYMKRAGVPREIQRRVVRLPEDEMARFLNEWFMGVIMPQGVGPPGES